MRTDVLIATLARGPIAVDSGGVARALAVALAAGATVAAAAMLAGLGPRPDLAEAMQSPMFWLKVGAPLLFAAFALAATARLARPGPRARGAAIAVATTALALWAMATVDIASAPAGLRLHRLMGASALPCVISIVALALPLFVALFVALRRLAPTRLRLAGAAAGGLAGALAGAVYAFHCNETTVAFLAVWYLAGMAIPAALGGALGPRLLRWS